nr:histidinol-phosphate transaminase [Motilibacter aurantiacus]
MEELPIRPELRGKSPYGAPQLDVPVRLNTNENPYPPSAALIADLAASVSAAAAELNRYPDREALALRGKLAAYLSRTGGVQLSAEQVWAANGSNEVLQQILQAFGGPGRVALGFEPTYSMHSLISQGTSTTYVVAPREAESGFRIDPAVAVEAVAEHDPDVVFLCSPNNPTGTALEADVVEEVYAATAGVVVVDEAYAEFSHAPSLLRLLPGRPRLIVSRTMSKAFAFAGGRLGYLAADPAVVDALRLVRLPYHLSVMSQEAARAALRHADDTLASVDLVKAQRDRIVRELRARGLQVVDSDANFVLFGRFEEQADVWQALLDRGVLVRDVGLAGWLRVTAGTEEETSAFLRALDDAAPQQAAGDRAAAQRAEEAGKQ